MDRLMHVRQRRRLMEAVKLAARQKSNDDGEEETPTKKAPVTVVRTKYRTLAPTFTGEIAGYTTIKSGEAKPTPATTSERAETTIVDKGTPAQAPPPEETKLTPTSLIVAPDADRGVTTPTSAATQLPIATEKSSTNAASSSNSNSDSNDASAGAKAGIAIGVIAGVLILAGLIFFLIRRKKNKGERQSLEDDEKLHGAFSSANYTPTAAAAVTAAAVASSPVTYGNYNEKPVGAAAAPAPFNRGPNEQPRSPGVSGWERPMTSQSQNSANPFGPHAELPGSMPPSPSSGAPIAAAAVAGAAAGAAAVHGMQRQTSRNRGHGPKPLDLTVGPPAPLQGIPPSPVGTEYSVNSISPGQQFPASSSAAAIAAAGGPAGSMVHRVQLDFKPTLEDELELKAGQLVRLLHEYDDGWALCIRLDRSRQGVVPRTCLSTRPVKPRAPGGPNGQQRIGPPVNPSGRPMTPSGRPMTPQNGSPAPLQIRPESPARPGTPSGLSYPPQQPAPGPRYQPMPLNQRPGTPNSMGGQASPVIPRTMSPAPGPLSAPIPAPVAAPVAAAAAAPAPAPAPAAAPAPAPAPEPAPAPAPILPPVAVSDSPTLAPVASPSPPILAPIPISAPLAALDEPVAGPTAESAGPKAPEPTSSPAPSASTPASPSSPLSGPKTGSISRKPVPGQAM